jgi:hypothetical protein
MQAMKQSEKLEGIKNARPLRTQQSKAKKEQNRTYVSSLPSSTVRCYANKLKRVADPVKANRSCFFIIIMILCLKPEPAGGCVYALPIQKIFAKMKSLSRYLVFSSFMFPFFLFSLSPSLLVINRFGAR